MGLDLHSDCQIPGGRSFGAMLTLPLEPKLGTGIDARRNLDHQAFRLTRAALNLDRRLAAADGGQEGDGQARFHRAAGSLPAGPAAANPAHQVLEDARSAGLLTLMPTTEGAQQVGQVDCLEARLTTVTGGPVAGAGSRPGRGHPFERRVAVLVIPVPLFLVRQDVVSLLELLELRLGRLVARIDVGMVLPSQAR